ncbi:unnamed protein product [Cuscuta europaea]|uniref:C2 domain-containing protein n=1 Tax=Cuscuta europaea TaxID=41803 RepID=A0A9P0ZGG8_CUSEU|nr:unnamed protein product [Cuscuta europaea]
MIISNVALFYIDSKEQFSKCGLDGSLYGSEEKAVDDRTIGHNPERSSLLKGGIVYSNAVVSKYELQEFLKPSLRVSSQSKKQSLQPDGFQSSSSIQKSEGLVEFIGILRIKVIKGTNLAVRDMLSSDPYVVLTLGQQKAQTTVMKSNLNPIWNEELMLSLPQEYGPLKLCTMQNCAQRNAMRLPRKRDLKRV